MKLSISELSKSEQWDELGIAVPAYDIPQLKARTEAGPGWIHFGAGNIFRGYIARLLDGLLDRKEIDTGIIAVESFDFEIIEKVYQKYDNLALNVLMGSNGHFRMSITGSIVRGMTTRHENGDYDRLRVYVENPGLQIISFTITEKGYELRSHTGEYLPLVRNDIEAGPKQPRHVMAIITSLLYHRFQKGGHPVALLSLDNCSRNGDKLLESITAIAKEWNSRGLIDPAFTAYLTDQKNVSFPLSMIDKITPRPADSVKEMLAGKGLEEMEIVTTSKSAYMAPFINAEVPEYLVVEDRFPNGRPPLENAGVLFTDRETVNKVETMKVMTCLNPLHTALAVTGCLLGFTSISEEMKDPLLVRLITRIGYEEGLPVVVDPGIIDPKQFIDEVVTERLPNPYIPDTPQRIASDTSQKIKIRFGETIKAYCSDEQLDPASLTGIQLALAAWCRYLLGVDDSGNIFTISPDPMSDYLEKCVSGISIGDTGADISHLLANADIFGIDLYEAGLAGNIETMFIKMVRSPGSVRSTLKEYLE